MNDGSHPSKQKPPAGLAVHERPSSPHDRRLPTTQTDPRTAHGRDVEESPRGE